MVDLYDWVRLSVTIFWPDRQMERSRSYAEKARHVNPIQFHSNPGRVDLNEIGGETLGDDL